MRLLSLILLLNFVACSSDQKSTELKSVGPREIVVMSYNVENLFDTQHDQGKSDWTYLPSDNPQKKIECEKVASSYRRRECFETNWTPGHLALKISQLSRVIMEGRSERPDILALSEVENEAVVSMLAKSLGYDHFIVTNGDDERGIDVALLWTEAGKLKMLSHKEHTLRHPLFDKRATRPILEAKLSLGERPLYIFVNHWPSLGNPDETKIVAAKFLKGRMDKILNSESSASVIALGDFNTIDRLHPHPFQDVLLKGEAFVDVEASYRKKLSYNQKSAIPPGSYFYAKEMQWNQLDHIFVNAAMMKDRGTRVDLESFEIIAPKFAVKQERYEGRDDYLHGSRVTGVPWSYDHNASSHESAGFSDHFPLAVKILF